MNESDQIINSDPGTSYYRQLHIDTTDTVLCYIDIKKGQPAFNSFPLLWFLFAREMKELRGYSCLQFN
ncbi:unnamed protein product [Rotaria sordida]|nr:unnamed protein product [Rotaria sordida]CAF4105939.1 unnamed protein product [Rotaria sordida]